MARTYKVNDKYFLGVGLIKRLNNLDECPAKIHATLQGHDIESESMEKGNYFESLIVGCTSDGTIVNDLPRLQTGKKSVEQIRIEQQAEKCKDLLANHFKFTEKGKQVEFVAQLNDHFYIRTYVDIMGEADSEYIRSSNVVIDLKLTENTENKFGDFCWGTPEFIDHTQAYLIDFLYDQKFHVKPDFYYFVFGYNPAMGFKFLKKQVSEVDRMEMVRKMEYAMERVAIFESEGWKEFPTYSNCKNCPIKESCKSYRAVQIEII